MQQPLRYDSDTEWKERGRLGHAGRNPLRAYKITRFQHRFTFESTSHSPPPDSNSNARMPWGVRRRNALEACCTTVSDTSHWNGREAGAFQWCASASHDYLPKHMVRHPRCVFINQTGMYLMSNTTIWRNRYVLFIYNSDVWLTVHRNSMWIRKPTRCHFLYSLFLF